MNNGMQTLLSEEGDKRPKHRAWAPGNYVNRCWSCSHHFQGDKHARECADCAYLENWLDKALSKLKSLSGLEEGWDGYKARAVNKSCVKHVEKLLIVLYSKGIPQPSIVPTCNETIQIEWHTNDIDLEIEILNDSTALLYFEDPGNRLEEGKTIKNWDDLNPFTNKLKQGDR